MRRKWTNTALPLLLLVTIIVQCIISAPTPAKADKEQTPYEKYGAIKIADYDHDGKSSTKARRQLCDENGTPIQLKGMSTFGLQWDDGSWILNEKAFDALAYDWKCDVVRLAMYVGEGGYASNPKTILERVEKGIELATERGMYVIVDWHVLNPGNPSDSTYLNAGCDLDVYKAIKKKHPKYTGPQLFFAYLSQKYGDQKNIIWEIANEPNGLGGDSVSTWKDKLLPYHQSIVDAIRTYDKDDIDNIIICGTDNWSQYVDAPISNPVVDENNQIMYTMHFYAGTHDTAPGGDGKYWLGSMVDNALNHGLAVFCTEWGTSEASGNGGPYMDYSDRWLKYLETQKISWCAWSLAKKNETSAAMLNATPTIPIDHNKDGYPDWKKEELSATGNYLREKIRSKSTTIKANEKTWKATTDSHGCITLTASKELTNLTGKVTKKTSDGIFRDGNGKKLTNAIVVTKYKHTFILGDEGKPIKSRFVKNTNGDTYFVNSKGYVVYDKKFRYKKNDYLALEDGTIGIDSICITPLGNLCYTGLDGVIAKSTWVKVDGKTYYCNRNGKIVAER